MLKTRRKDKLFGFLDTQLQVRHSMLTTWKRSAGTMSMVTGSIALQSLRTS